MAKNSNIQTGKNNDEQKEQNTLKVVIESNHSLLKILSDWKSTRNVVGTLLILVVVILLALTFATILIKRIYPYNDIKVNLFGAITMQNEDVEIIYWLFNTADLWANSGIKVKKGDILTIRASGRFHTAIHHLVDDASKNQMLRDNWVDTDGNGKQSSRRDSLRANYRIFPNKPHDALLMQVMPQNTNIRELDSIGRDKYLLQDTISDKDKSNKQNFHYIGKERVDLIIYQDGELHFAVNEVVLTKCVIDSMISKQTNLLKEKPKSVSYTEFNENKDQKYKSFGFGKHPIYPTDTTKNEMNYYAEEHYYNAWFDDNVGSFLIAIERKSK